MSEDNDRAHRRDMVLMRMNVTAEERTALLHLRGHRHHAPACPVCRAEQAGIAIGRRLAEGECPQHTKEAGNE